MAAPTATLVQLVRGFVLAKMAFVEKAMVPAIARALSMEQNASRSATV